MGTHHRGTDRKKGSVNNHREKQSQEAPQLKEMGFGGRASY